MNSKKESKNKKIKINKEHTIFKTVLRSLLVVRTSRLLYGLSVLYLRKPRAKTAAQRVKCTKRLKVSRRVST